MAIAYARVEYPGRSDNGGNANACCKSAYNARSIIRDNRTGVTYDWEWKGDNVYHDMLLPNYVDHKFKDISEFANEVERSEKRKDSQLFEEWVLALPKEEEVTLEMKKELVLEFVKRKGWIEEGLGVQIDIHAPHEYGSKKAVENERLSNEELAEKELNENWHAHLLVTTRRFKKDGLGLEEKKASDLKPEIKYGKVQKSGEISHHLFWKEVQEDKFGEWGLDLKVDLPHEITQEHIGPVRMRSVMNGAVMRNEERRIANIENLSSGDDLLRYVSKHMSVFSKSDLMRATKIIEDKEQREALVADALKNQSLVVLHEEDGKESGYYTTKEVRKEEEKILRLSGYVAQEGNALLKGSYKQMSLASAMLEVARQSGQLTQEQYEALSHVLFTRSGVRILRGRAGTG
ncbi:MAG: MobA/MobL family protein, partial [Proteobacteria bacterium]|nr:MobA/MobL family protein [Pseudomonadota bacterium]